MHIHVNVGTYTYLGILKNELTVNNCEYQEAHVPSICSPYRKLPFIPQVRISEVTAPKKHFLFRRSRDELPLVHTEVRTKI